MIVFVLNREEYRTDPAAGSRALDLIRNRAGLKGTKEGCREGDCGACTILLGTPSEESIAYRSAVSCILPAEELHGRHCVTIEGLNDSGGLSAIQRAFVEQGASQCGFCTPGMIVSLTGYFLNTLKPNVDDAVDSLAGNLCRCTGYAAVRRAVESVIREMGPSGAGDCRSREHTAHLIRCGILPSYFTSIIPGLEGIPPLTLKDCRDNALKVAGGTDLWASHDPQPPLRFLSREEGLREITAVDGEVTIGAGASITDIMGSEVLKGIGNFHEGLGLISSTQIRNRATPGGNIVNASPIADLVIMLMPLNPLLLIRGPERNRELPLADIYLGYKELDLRPNETLISLRFTVPGGICNFEKVAMRKHLDIASVNSSSLIQLSGGRIEKAAISAGGVAPVPLLLESAAAVMKDRKPDNALLEDAARAAMAEVSPISDVRGSADYKRELLGQLVKAHLLNLMEREREE